ncbi:Ras family protein [Entamoeba marina]
MNIPHQNKIKCVFVGDTGCGKTSLIEMIINNEIYNGLVRMYPDFLKKNVIIDRDMYQFVIWDTAGQDRFRLITKTYYRNSDICVLMYDITNKQSFENIDRWHSESINGIEEYEYPLIYILIGNKRELENERQVSYEEAQLYAEEHKMLFLEISVHQQTNVSSSIIDPLFSMIIDNWNERNERIEIRNIQRLQNIERQQNIKTNTICSIA